jgi:ABC-type tungstate transport system permease subunit
MRKCPLLIGVILAAVENGIGLRRCSPYNLLIAKPSGTEAMVRIAVLVLSVLTTSVAQAQERFITICSATSVQDSGLMGYIAPIFHAATGVTVQVKAVGTGQALAMGERGDADALLLQDRAGEEKFVAEGYGLDSSRRHA